MITIKAIEDCATPRERQLRTLLELMADDVTHLEARLDSAMVFERELRKLRVALLAMVEFYADDTEGRAVTVLTVSYVDAANAHCGSDPIRHRVDQETRVAPATRKENR